MLYGRYSAVFYALLLHTAILVIISFTQAPPKSPRVEASAIQSYLYRPPTVSQEPRAEAIVSTQELTPTDKPVHDDKAQLSTQKNEPKSTAKQLPEQTVPIAETSETNEQPETKPTKAALPTTQKAVNFSPAKQLSNLRQKLDSQALTQDLEQYQRVKSASIMHGEPVPVPHSAKQLTKEEKNAQASYQLDSGLKTIKGDDGTCFIERDLSAVGIEGVSSRESFNCGQSKFDKNFKSHMKKVLKKLGK